VEVRPDIIVLCHGGPIAEPSDAETVLHRTHGIAGFFGASSIERLAAEPAIEEQARRFRSITLGPAGASARSPSAPRVSSGSRTTSRSKASASSKTSPGTKSSSGSAKNAAKARR
jgi:hypothetical protein